MRKRAAVFIDFVRYFFRYVRHVQEVLIGLLMLILAGGLAFSKIEGIELGNALYFACITGLTIGYGDISPETACGKALSVAIGLVGLLFTGITVAIATRALKDLSEHYQTQE